MNKLLKRLPLPDGLTPFPKMDPPLVYVGQGSPELGVAKGNLWCMQSTGAWWGPDHCIFVGRGENCHYALPADSEFLAPETKEFTLRPPEGCPPLPEDGLEDMGMAWKGMPGDHDGWYCANKGASSWAKWERNTETSASSLCRYLRRPPVKPVKPPAHIDIALSCGVPARVTKDGVTVGCRTVPAKDVEAIHKLMDSRTETMGDFTYSLPSVPFVRSAMHAITFPEVVRIMQDIEKLQS